MAVFSHRLHDQLAFVSNQNKYGRSSPICTKRALQPSRRLPQPTVDGGYRLEQTAQKNRRRCLLKQQSHHLLPTVATAWGDTHHCAHVETALALLARRITRAFGAIVSAGALIVALQVVVMCKAPVVGRVKTRLINSTIDAAQACALHKAMAEVVIRRAIHLFPGAVTIAADDPQHPFFHPFAQPMVAQGDGDLGCRMARVADAIIDQCSVLFLGTDSPHMDGCRLRQAAQLATSHDAVVGPVEDGGYDLILLNSRKSMVLLHAIDWGSSQVWQQTHSQAKQASLDLAALPIGFDVDCKQDLDRSQALGWSIQ